MDPRPGIKGTPKREKNPVAVKGIFTADWKDTALLRTFVHGRGKIRARRVTRLTLRQQPSW